MAAPPVPPTPPPPPSTAISKASSIILGKYQLGRLLGRGSFAKVYQAQSLKEDKTYAVKIIEKPATGDAHMEPRITREVSAMKKLQHHPNILKIHEVMATKTKIYLVMELARGGELFTKIARRGRLTESSARRYFQQLVSALHFCHQNGVAHRDLKPQNLLLDQDGNLKVSDFGLSALPEQLRDGLLHTACGTPAYTAPEVVTRRGAGYDGVKTDAWSCGVILFVLLSGYLPFDDSNLVTMYKKIYKREYSFPAWISRSSRWVISQLLDPDPNTRMSIEGLMNTAWFKKALELKKQDVCLFEKESFLGKDCRTMNAFDIISLSSGLDLSGLFEATNKKGKRFTSMASVGAVEERVREVGGKLGYKVENGKNGSIGLGKGRSLLLVQALEMTESMLWVEVKVIDGVVEFEELHWGDLKASLDDVVLSWHNEAD